MEGLVDKLCHRFSNVQAQAQAGPPAAVAASAGNQHPEEQRAEQEDDSGAGVAAVKSVEEGGDEVRGADVQVHGLQPQQQQQQHAHANARTLQQWRTLAFCLSLLPLSERAVKRLAENLKLYSEALADEAVMELLKAALGKVRARY